MRRGGVMTRGEGSREIGDGEKGREDTAIVGEGRRKRRRGLGNNGGPVMGVASGLTEPS